MDDLLDRPIWNALTTEQARFAERDGDAVRFPPAVTGLAALRVPTEEALAGLARLMAPGEVTGLFLDGALALPPSLARVDGAVILQMRHDGVTFPPAVPVETIGGADLPTMRALAEATRPGPFSTRTHELGTFLGVRDADGRVVAMAGQRMRLPGMIEISAVCTDPAHTGRGHAVTLMTAQLALIHAAGARAFLHVKDDNTRAIAVYARLGFQPRRRFDYAIVRRI